MAINKKLITFTKKSTFLGANGINNTISPTNGNYGNIPSTSVVFILDTGEIWTHGKYISGGVWGTEQTGYVPLTIKGTTYNLSTADHTHNYRPNTQPTKGNWFNGTPLVGGDGVTELGKYIDFHHANDSTADYSVRLICPDYTGITVTLPSTSGTLALTSQIPTSLKNPNSLTIQTNGTSLGSYDGSSSKTWNITYSNVGAAAASHTHSLLHYDLCKTLDNTTEDSGWSMINGAYSGFILKSLRTQASAPSWILGNFAAGIAFGGADTKGVLSVAYGSAGGGFRIAGGNGSKPVWWMNICGTSGKSYSLDSYLPLAGGTMNNGARIDHGGNLYIGRSDNAGWIGVQDICSQSSLGDGNWSLRIDGTAHFKNTTVTGNLSVSSQLYLPINGNYQAIKIGDDCWLGDCNVTNVIGLCGVQNNNAGGIKFGKGGMYIGYDGSNHYASSTSLWSNFNADLFDGYHESSFLRYRTYTGTDQENSLWSQIGIKEYHGALPDGLSGVYNYGEVISLPGQYCRYDIYVAHTSTSGSGIWMRSGWGDDKKSWKCLAFTDSNVASATKLATTRTIWGQNFDGTQNIEISAAAKMPYVLFKRYDTNDNAGYVGRGSSGNNNLYMDTYDTSNSIVLGGGGCNVGIGTVPSYRLHVSGNIFSTSGFLKSGSSDSYVLLGGGGHKAVSDFSLSGHTHSYLPTSGGTMTGMVYFSNVTSGLNNGIRWTVGDNDYAIIRGGATGSNYGYLEIATADDGNEPIYIRQYTGVFSTIKRTLTLLDGNGYSYFPSYINIGGNEGNNSSPNRVWGSNGSDTFLRSYLTSALNVNYASSSGNSDTVDGYHASGLFTNLSNSNNGVSITIGGTTKSISNISVNYANTSWGSTWLNANTSLNYGTNGLQYFNQSTTTTSGPKVNANPTNDWYHIIRMNHGNSNGYYVDLASCFHSNSVYYRRIVSGTDCGWIRLIDSSNIGSQSVNYANSAGTASNLYFSNDDATLTLYGITSGQNSAYGAETVGIQSCFDGQNPTSSSYVTSYTNRCQIALQPRGGRVAIGTTNASYTLDVAGDVYSSGYVRAASGFVKANGNAAQLLRADGGVATFNWSGQGGQPSWLWGGNSQHAYYVYNPSNFSVNYANSAGSAGKLSSRGATTNIANQDATTKAESGLILYDARGYTNRAGTNNYSTVISACSLGTIQIAGDWGDDYTRNLYWRSQSDREIANYPWKAWRTILDTENYSTYLNYLPLTGGDITGQVRITRGTDKNGLQIQSGSENMPALRIYAATDGGHANMWIGSKYDGTSGWTISSCTGCSGGNLQFKWLASNSNMAQIQTDGSVKAKTFYNTNGTEVSYSGHTHTFSSISNKPTTLSGYGITDGVNTVTTTGTISASISGHNLSLSSSTVALSASISNHTLSISATSLDPTTGVFILDDDGNFTYYESWNTANNSKAAALAVITDTKVTIMDLYENDAFALPWQNDMSTVNEIVNTSNMVTAISDLNGFDNTEAAYYNDYDDGTIFGYAISCTLGGLDMNGYIGSAGEWYIILSNVAAVQTAIGMVGGDPLSIQTGDYWTSTQGGAYNAAWSVQGLAIKAALYTDIKSTPKKIRLFFQ